MSGQCKGHVACRGAGVDHAGPRDHRAGRMHGTGWENVIRDRKQEKEQPVLTVGLNPDTRHGITYATNIDIIRVSCATLMTT